MKHLSLKVLKSSLIYNLFACFTVNCVNLTQYLVSYDIINISYSIEAFCYSKSATIYLVSRKFHGRFLIKETPKKLCYKRRAYWLRYFCKQWS